MVNNIIKVSCFIFVLQSVAWMIIAMLSILCIENIMQVDRILMTYNNLLFFHIYILFFDKSYIFTFDDVYSPTVTAQVFEIFACIYFLISFMWLVTSVFVGILAFNKMWSTRVFLQLFWLCIGFINCIVDLIFTIMLGCDLGLAITFFNKYSNMIPNDTYSNTVTAMGVVMTVAARGFTLYLVNFTLLVIVAVQLRRRKDVDTISNASSISEASSSSCTSYCNYCNRTLSKSVDRWQ